MQPKKIQNGKKRRALHRNMQLPCDAILEEPERFHRKKQKYNNNPKQEATDHKFAYNNSNTENSKVQFQRLTLVKVDE